MGLIFFLSHQSTLPEPLGLSAQLTSIAGHFLVYAVLAALLWWALGLLELSPGRRLALAFLGAMLYGMSDEWHQSFVPGRDPAAFDLVIDALGALTSLALLHLLLRRRQAGGRGRR